jgi:hypothetical protein
VYFREKGREGKRNVSAYGKQLYNRGIAMERSIHGVRLGNSRSDDEQESSIHRLGFEMKVRHNIVETLQHVQDQSA